MKNLLDNKRLLIVGAGGLLGRIIVKNALEQGAKVIAADTEIEKLKQILIDLNVDINQTSLSFAEINITNEESVKNFFSKELDVDGAVNATYPRNKNYGAHFLDVTLDDFNENITLHLGSTFVFTQQCAIYFKKKNKPFSLVNISSIYGVIAPDFSIYENTSMTMPVEYAAVKSALTHLNKYVVKYINDSRFRINAVSPGGIFDSQHESFLQAYKNKTFGKGMLDVENVIGAILFLLSDQSSYVTGQNIIIDDGFSL